MALEPRSVAKKSTTLCQMANSEGGACRKFFILSFSQTKKNPENSAHSSSWKESSSTYRVLDGKVWSAGSALVVLVHHMRVINATQNTLSSRSIEICISYFIYFVSSFSNRLSHLCQSNGCARAVSSNTPWYSCISCVSNQHNWTTKYFRLQRELTKRVYGLSWKKEIQAKYDSMNLFYRHTGTNTWKACVPLHCKSHLSIKRLEIRIITEGTRRRRQT